MRLGIALLNQGRPADAGAALQRALELDPRNSDIHLNLGQAAYHARDSARARQHFDTALRLSPDHVDAMFNLGVIALGKQQLDAARSWFERVLVRAPHHADALVNLASSHSNSSTWMKPLSICGTRSKSIHRWLRRATIWRIP